MKNNQKSLFLASAMSVAIATFFVQPAIADIQKLSCLEKDGRKVVLLYDRHDYGMPDACANSEGLCRLAQELPQRGYRAYWLLEFPERSRALLATREPDSSINAFNKKAFTGELEHALTTFESFDARPNIFFWVQEMMCNLHAFRSAIQGGHQFPEDFKEVTKRNYLQNVLNRQQEIQQLIAELNIAKSTKDSLLATHKKAVKVIRTQLCKQDKNEHMFNFLRTADATKNFCLMVQQEASIYADAHILHKVITKINSEDTATIFVYAGATHAEILAQALEHIGFAERFPEKVAANDLRVTDFCNISWATNPPKDYIDDILHFIESEPRRSPAAARLMSSYAPGISIEIAPAPSAPSREYRAQIPMPQSSSQPVQQSAPSIKIETGPRYYPAALYKKALDAAMWKK